MAGVPLELVKYDTATGKFIVGTDALQVLRKVRQPVGVVAVCGRARQGKSFILNQLLQQTSGHGFTVGPTHRPCTKGLWMWSSPQRHVAVDGSESYLVLLDTEGIDAYDQTAQYSTQIFSLAVLLSCLFVYNHMGGIDESALDRLSLVTEMTKHIRVKAGKGDDDALGEFTPSFLWLLRDFYLKLEENGRKITAKDYLETALMAVEGEGASVKAKNEIRSSIKSLFPDRDCFSLVRPMNDELQLANLDSVPRSQLRPEFSQGVAKLVNLIFSKAQPKRFGNGFMNGPVLAGLVEAYVKAINEGAVPTIATAWQGVAESESRRAADAAEGKYKESFNASVNADDKDLLSEHQRCIELARAVFMDIAVGDENIRKAHEARYLKNVEVYFKDLSSRKLAEAASQVNEMLYKANMAITRAARTGGSLVNVQEELSAFIAQYAASATGPTKWEKLAEFLKDTYPALAQEAVSRAEATGKQSLDKVMEELQQARAQLAALQERAAKVERQYADASSNAGTLQQQLHALRDELAAIRVECDSRGAKIQALEAQLKETAAMAESRILAAERECEARVRQAQDQFGSRAAEAQAALAAERTRASGLVSDTAALNSKLGTAESQIKSLHEEVTDWRMRYNTAVEDKVRVMRERDEARDEAASFHAERDTVAREKNTVAMRLEDLQRRMEAEERYKTDMQTRLDAMIAEAQQARAEALAMRENGAKSRLPHAMATITTQSDSSGLADTYSKMSIQEIRDSLTMDGYEAAVWELANRRPAPKRADWLDLAKRVNTAGNA